MKQILGCYQFKPLLGKRVRVRQANQKETIGDLTAIRQDAVILYCDSGTVRLEAPCEVSLCENSLR